MAESLNSCVRVGKTTLIFVEKTRTKLTDFLFSFFLKRNAEGIPKTASVTLGAFYSTKAGGEIDANGDEAFLPICCLVYTPALTSYALI